MRARWLLRALHGAAGGYGPARGRRLRRGGSRGGPRLHLLVGGVADGDAPRIPHLRRLLRPAPLRALRADAALAEGAFRVCRAAGRGRGRGARRGRRLRAAPAALPPLRRRGGREDGTEVLPACGSLPRVLGGCLSCHGEPCGGRVPDAPGSGGGGLQGHRRRPRGRPSGLRARNAPVGHAPGLALPLRPRRRAVRRVCVRRAARPQQRAHVEPIPLPCGHDGLRDPRVRDAARAGKPDARARHPARPDLRARGGDGRLSGRVLVSARARAPRRPPRTRRRGPRRRSAAASRPPSWGPSSASSRSRPS